MDEFYRGLTINESEYPLQGGGYGRLAIFIYTGEREPSVVLDAAISEYVQQNGYHEWVDANMDNPWVRAIMSDVNGMNQEPFDYRVHRINRPLR